MARIIVLFLLAFCGIANAANVSDGTTTVRNVRNIIFNGAVLTGSTANGVANVQVASTLSDITEIPNRSHTDLQDIGTNTHAQIDSHIADGTLHFTQAAISITESQISDLSHTVDTDTQLTQEQVEDYVDGVIVGGTNLTATYDDGAGTLTLDASGGAPSGSNGSIQFSESGAFASDSSNLIWDDTNNRLGINTSTPDESLQVNGNLFVTGWIGADANNNFTPNSGTNYYLNSAGAINLNIDTNNNETNRFLGVRKDGLNSAGSLVFRVYEDGVVNINETGTAAMLNVQSNTSSKVTALFKGAASQSANLTEWQNSAGTVLTQIDEHGHLGVDVTPFTGVPLSVGGDIWAFKNAVNPRFLFGDNSSSPNYGGLRWDSAENDLHVGTSPIADLGQMIMHGDGSIDMPAGTLDVKGLTVNGAFTLPAADGSAGQVLETDGSGTVTWETPSGGGGGGSASGANGAIQFANSGAFDSDAANLFWDDTNNRLGVGTNSPDNPLHFVVDSSTTAFSTITAPVIKIANSNSTTNSYAGLHLRANTADTFIANIYKGANLADLAFIVDSSTGVTERMRITSDGDIGINDSTPDSKLDIEIDSSGKVGQIIKGAASQSANLQEWQDSAGDINSYVDEDGAFVINETAQAISPFRVETSSQPYAIYVASSGRIGINTATASSDLNIGGTGIVSAFGSANQLRNFNTIQTGTSGTARLTVNAGEIQIGGGVSGASKSIKSHNTSSAPIGLQQVDGGLTTMVVIRDNGGTQTMGITTSGLAQAGEGNGVPRFDLSHTVTPASADGDGSGVSLKTENASGTLKDIAFIDAVYTDISEDDVTMTFSVRNSAEPVEALRINPDKTLTIANAYTLPATDGTANQVLQTDGSGTLTFATASGGGGTPGGSDSQVQYNDSSAFGGEAGFTYNDVSNTLAAPTVEATTNFRVSDHIQFIDVGTPAFTGDALYLNGSDLFFDLTGSLGPVKINNTAYAGSDHVLFGTNLEDADFTGGSGDNVGLGHNVFGAIAGTLTGSDNICIGMDSCSGWSGNSNDNIVIGDDALNLNTTGNGNIIIGSDIELLALGSTNALNIGNTIFGNLSNKEIAIGGSATEDPVATLVVDGAGTLALKEVAAPSAVSGFGQIYTKTDSNLYFKDDGGTETQLNSSGGGDPWTTLQTTSDQALTSTTMTAITGLSFSPSSASGNKTFLVEFMIPYTFSDTSKNTSLGWVETLNTVYFCRGYVTRPDSSTINSKTEFFVNETAQTGAIAGVLGGGLQLAQGSFVIRVGTFTTGSIGPGFRLHTSGTVTVSTGAYLRYREIGTN